MYTRKSDKESSIQQAVACEVTGKLLKALDVRWKVLPVSDAGPAHEADVLVAQSASPKGPDFLHTEAQLGAVIGRQLIQFDAL